MNKTQRKLQDSKVTDFYTELGAHKVDFHSPYCVAIYLSFCDDERFPTAMMVTKSLIRYLEGKYIAPHLIRCTPRFEGVALFEPPPPAATSYLLILLKDNPRFKLEDNEGRSNLKAVVLEWANSDLDEVKKYRASAVLDFVANSELVGSDAASKVFRTYAYETKVLQICLGRLG